MKEMEKEKSEEKKDLLLVWISALAGSSFIGFVAVAGIGYSGLIGLCYFIAFMVCIPFFFYLMGYPLYPGQKRFNLEE